MDRVIENYDRVLYTPSDIYEHIPTLYRYTRKCQSVIELGVRECVSTWAFIRGLLENEDLEKKKTLVLCDLENHDNIKETRVLSEQLGIEFMFFQGSSLDVPLSESVDLVFIDTWHVYGHLKKELEKFAPYTRKYIIMHDTEVDKYEGESIRLNHDIPRLSQCFGIPEDEIRMGLQKAIDEFLDGHPEWMIDLIKTNNNGLTVLSRNDII